MKSEFLLYTPLDITFEGKDKIRTQENYTLQTDFWRKPSLYCIAEDCGISL